MLSSWNKVIIIIINTNGFGVAGLFQCGSIILREWYILKDFKTQLKVSFLHIFQKLKNI